jgi:hypothetical protein
MNINDLDSYEVVEVPEPKSEVDKPINLSDLSNYEVTQPVNEQDQSENITQTPFQAAIAEGTPAMAAGGTEALRQGTASSSVSSLAEDLAFRGGGGYSSPRGKEILDEYNVYKGILDAAPESVVIPTVTPSSVGRQLLDSKLLGVAGLGTESGNRSRAVAASIKNAKPVDELVSSLSTPINREDVYNRMQELLDVNNLDPGLEQDMLIRKKMQDLQSSQVGFQLPSESELSKQKLQETINYSTLKTAADRPSEQVEKAQARALREQVEKVAKDEGLLEEFRKRKAVSGSTQAASEMAMQKSKTVPNEFIFPGSRAIKTVEKAFTDKLPAVLGSGLDTVGKVAKSKFGKALPYAIGALVGGVPAVASEVVGEAMDVEPSGATMESPAAQEDYLYESGIRDPKQMEEAKRLYNFKQGLPNQGRMDEVPSAYDKPETKLYKENVLKAKERGQLKDNYVTPLADKASDLEKLQQLHEQFRSMSGKGAEAMASTIDKSINGTDEEKIKSDFVLKQNQAIRNKLY